MAQARIVKQIFRRISGISCVVRIEGASHRRLLTSAPADNCDAWELTPHGT
jgi:hypothetical protein